MANTDELLPGTLLQHRYRIVEKAGGGGMGVVYKAIDRRVSNRYVAIKELKQDTSASEEERDRNIQLFNREVAILGRLQHPNIPRVYGNFQEKGRYYLVMDYIKGETLTQKLRRSGNASLQLADVLSYGIQLCEVLAYLHNSSPRIIFRDLKPPNVMVTGEGKLFLIDFGIARYFKPEKLEDTFSYGTKGYIAPEIAAGGQSNALSDLYSLGVTLHQCLTGRAPTDNTSLFDFPSVRMYNREVPDELDRLILHLLSKNPADRPSSAIDVGEKLCAIRDDLLAAHAILPVTVPMSQPLLPPDPYTAPTVPATVNTPTVRQFSDVLRELLVPLRAWGVILLGAYTALRPRIPSLLLAVLHGLKALLLWLLSFFLWLLRALFSPQRFGQLTVQVQQKGRELFRLARSHIRQWSFTSSVWTRQFLMLLGGSCALILLASIYLIKAFHFSYYSVDLCITLILVPVIFALAKMMNRREPRNALIGAGAAILFFLLALLLLPEAGQVARATAQPLTFNGLLCWSVMTLAVGALIANFLSSLSTPHPFLVPVYPPRATRRWLDRLSLVTLLAICTLLQYGTGNTEQVPFVPGYPLATPFAQGSAPVPLTINTLVCAGMLLIALILLLPKAAVYPAERWFFAIAALPTFLLLQWVQGPAELQRFFSSIDLNTAVTFNGLLCVILVIAFILFLRSQGHQLDLYGNAALLVIAIIFASLQNFMGGSVSIQGMSLSSSLPLFKLYLFIPALLLVVALLLLFHFKDAPGILDRLALSTLALVCAVIESAIGRWELHALGALSSHSGFAAFNEAGLAHLYQLLSIPLVILVILAILIAISVPLLAAPGLVSRVQRVLQWVDRATMLLIIGPACLLLFSFLMKEQIQPAMQNPAQPSQTLIVLAALNILVLVTLAISFLVTLGRFSRPQSGGDRFMLIVCMLAFMLLLLESKEAQHVPELTTNVQQLVGSWFQLSVLSKALAIGLIGSSLISFYWLSRPFQRTDRLILGIIFALATLLAWFQFSHLQYVQIFFALLLLLSGILTATQIERVRVGSGP